MPHRRVRDLTLAPSANTSAEWQSVSAAVRNTSFFSARIEDERLLAGLQALVDRAVAEGWSVNAFIDEATKMLDDIWLETPNKDESFEQSFTALYNPNRLRLIYKTQRQLSDGFRQFIEDFDPYQLQVYPAWEFYRQPGAKEQNKRPDHVRHERVVRLKTDLRFWLARNSPEQGGFANPYGPWGFNSWMRTSPVDRGEAERLGLLKPGERVVIPPEYQQWNINNAISQLGTASVVDLSPEAQQRVIDDCDEEGIPVEPDQEDGTLHVIPPEDIPAPPELTPEPAPAPEPPAPPAPAPEAIQPEPAPQAPSPQPPVDEDGLFDIDSDEELEEWIRRQNEMNEGLSDDELINMI